MKIEWTSAQYHPDGTPRRRPLASTMHGWLTKLRGTLLDDEKTRWKGIQEMKEARAIRRRRNRLLDGPPPLVANLALSLGQKRSNGRILRGIILLLEDTLEAPKEVVAGHPHLVITVRAIPESDNSLM
ncbi:hypothetical protein EYR38_005799 [Pleurotus pulmonarius]|nr:hypothetical protein EYR38_005799 [Pleurotus pulmonarius]